MRKIFITLLAAIAATCLAIGISACSDDTSGNVRQIGIGYTHEQVEKLLGEPDEKTSDTLWLYYGKDYKELNAKLETNAKELIKAIADGDQKKSQNLLKEAVELEQQLENLIYEHTEVIFERSGDGYGVSYVFYDAMHRSGSDAPEKKLITVNLSDGAYYYIDQTKGENYVVIVNEQMGTDLPYKAEYADGSYSMGRITNAKITETDSLYNTKFSWSDKFGAYELTGEVLKLATIDENGVMECNSANIKKFILPAHVTSVSGVSTLSYAEKLEVEEGNAVYHADGNCIIETATKTVVGGCKNSVIPTDGSVTKIGDYAFRGCRLTSITIPNNITYIGEYAFYGTRLESIVIPESVTQLGKRAFSRCSIKSANIPSGVTEIPDYLFENCETNLTTVTLHDNITYIGQNAFWACHYLTDFTLPSKVKYIGERAFGACGSLNSINIPDTVEFIGKDAFIDSGYYKNANNWENGVLYIGKYLVNTNTGITSDYTVKSGTVSIADYAFDGSGVKNIILPESVRFIGKYAFSYYLYSPSVTVTFTNCEGWVSYLELDKENQTAVPSDKLASGNYANGNVYLERL